MFTLSLAVQVGICTVEGCRDIALTALEELGKSGGGGDV